VIGRCYLQSVGLKIPQARLLHGKSNKDVGTAREKVSAQQAIQVMAVILDMSEGLQQGSNIQGCAGAEHEEETWSANTPELDGMNLHINDLRDHLCPVSQ
jgi:hypothetical protein